MCEQIYQNRYRQWCDEKELRGNSRGGEKIANCVTPSELGDLLPLHFPRRETKLMHERAFFTLITSAIWSQTLIFMLAIHSFSLSLNFDGRISEESSTEHKHNNLSSWRLSLSFHSEEFRVNRILDYSLRANQTHTLLGFSRSSRFKYLLLIILIFPRKVFVSFRAIFSLFMATFLLTLPFPGQITQWNLIFYGTNDPPQKNDPPRVGTKKTVNDLVHNSLESSQWGFITQDVSTSHSHTCDTIDDCDHHQKVVWFVSLVLSAGDRRWRSLRCSTDCRRRPHGQFRMSKIFR